MANNDLKQGFPTPKVRGNVAGGTLSNADIQRYEHTQDESVRF